MFQYFHTPYEPYETSKQSTVKEMNSLCDKHETRVEPTEIAHHLSVNLHMNPANSYHYA